MFFRPYHLVTPRTWVQISTIWHVRQCSVCALPNITDVHYYLEGSITSNTAFLLPRSILRRIFVFRHNPSLFSFSLLFLRRMPDNTLCEIFFSTIHFHLHKQIKTTRQHYHDGTTTKTMSGVKFGCQQTTSNQQYTNKTTNNVRFSILLFKTSKT